MTIFQTPDMFGPKGFLNLQETFHFGKFEDTEDMTILFQTYNLKYPNKKFLVQKLFFFVLHNFLHFGKF